MTGFSYCPICQLPLKALLITPDCHVTQCMARCDENNEECPIGVECLSTDVFHYRDYSHKQLAAYRASANFVPPDIEIKPTKKRRTPRKSPKPAEPGKSPKSSRTPLRKKQKASAKNDSESDSEVLIPPKRVCKSLSFTNNSLPSTQTHEPGLDVKSRNSSVPSETKNKKSSAKKLKGNNKKCTVDSKTCNANVQKLTVKNINQTSYEEEVSSARPLSQSSTLSVSTAETSRLDDDSDHEYESTSSAGAKPTKNSFCHNLNLRTPILKLTDVGQKNTCDVTNLESENVENSLGTSNKLVEENVIESCHKELFSQVFVTDLDERRKEDSLLLTVASCRDTTATSSELKKTSRNYSSISESLSSFNSVSNENSCITGDHIGIEENFVETPSSPEVGNLLKNRRNHLLISATSSEADSDLPLAVLARSKSAKKRDDLCVFGNERSGDQFTKINHRPIGKSKAGRIIRESTKTVTGPNTPQEQIGLSQDICSDGKEESEKSFASKGNSSFVPSNATSTLYSDSVVSTDDMAPSYTDSSTFVTSSEMCSSETTTTDSSYSTSTHICTRPRRTPTKRRSVCKPVLSQSDTNSGGISNCSEISKKEEILFGKRRKSPLKTKSPKKTTLSNKAQCENKDSDDKSKWQALIHKMRQSCFPSDLKIDSEDSLTPASSYSSSDTSQASAHLPLRQCPFYKRIPDTPFAVDAFQYWNIPGVKVYFLSHFHSDHYIGIKKSFAHPIYCSQVTASLVRMKLRVEQKWLRVLELNSPQVICGVEVTALDANHCPGSFMFLFSLRNGKNYLHVGDFRASRAMTFHPSLKTIPISKLFLDTTYCSPQYCFPTQEEVIGKVIDIVRDHVKNHPKTLVVCGSYTIGKEKMFLGVAEALDWQVWARPEKQRVFACLSEPRVSSRLVHDPRSANVHVLPMKSIQVLSLQQHVQSCCGTFTHVIGVKPTGWELDHRSQQFKVTSRDNITIYGVPYSEHSSFTELRDFVQFLQPQEIVPTVNMGSAASRDKMNKHFTEWLRPQDCRSRAGSQTKVSQFFKQSSTEVSEV